MAIETVVTEAVAHAGVGVAISLVDFLSAKLTDPTPTRIRRKTRYLQAIDAILDAEAPPSPSEAEVTESQPSPSAPLQHRIVAKDSVEYAEQIAVVREYLRRSGLVKLHVPWGQRIKDGVGSLLTHEKINTLSKLPKLGIAVMLEIVYDIIFDFRMRGAVGIAASLYQIPALFLGLWAGTWINRLLNLFMSSGDERKIEKTLRQLLNETVIVTIVMQYEPPEQVKNELSSKGVEISMSQLTRAGKQAYKQVQQIAETAKEAASDVVHFPQKQQEKDAQEREERRKRFDELTKGH